MNCSKCKTDKNIETFFKTVFRKYNNTLCIKKTKQCFDCRFRHRIFMRQIRIVNNHNNYINGENT